jgi:hypothetical protein
MARILFFGIIFYLLYRLVFDLIIPVINTTLHIRRQFRNMQNPVNGQADPGAQPRQEHARKTPVGDYIDFEEVKK